MNLLISGHVHFQEEKVYDGKKILHPGSVGVPWYFDGRTQYIMLHGSKRGWEAEFFQLDYDVEKLVKDFETSGLNEKSLAWSKITIHTLRTGIDHNLATYGFNWLVPTIICGIIGAFIKDKNAGINVTTDGK